MTWRSRGKRPTRRTNRWFTVPLVVAMCVGSLATLAGAEVLNGAGGSTLRRESQLTPDRLGDNTLDGLQYGDPTEQLDLVEPPEANNQGGAKLELPLGIPPGRGGVQPDLTLRYDSGSGNGWLGVGWDLNVGEISVDTRWGVPRFLAGAESETYTLDGEMLSPTAIRSELESPRVVDRADFTRRADDLYDLIIRHGESPATYWWEVRSKMGGIKWYGGHPDKGGPTGEFPAPAPTPEDPEAEEMRPGLGRSGQDPSAILFNEQGHAVRWALSAERDVGVNEMRYFYEKVEGERVGDRATYGDQLYLKRIQYTAASPVGARAFDPVEDAAYEVTLLRDDDVPGSSPRQDVIVDARTGSPVVTSDLLRRVEVRYGAPVSSAADPHPDRRRTHDQLSRAFNLNYEGGAFGKSLLRSVEQVGSDNKTFATNELSYFDDVRNGDGSYNGFSSSTDYDTHNDTPDIPLGPFTADVSALGGATNKSGDAHAYLGFNLDLPSKMNSFGGSLTVSSGVTEAMAEMLDINGDRLPDKVYRKVPVGPVFFRLNRSGPNGRSDFGEERAVSSLPRLSSEADVSVGSALEAHSVASVQFDVAASVTLGAEYFADVNNDGLVDFVSTGVVLFNHLDPDGNPSFTSDSSQTKVPIDAGTLDLRLEDIEEIRKLEDQQRATSPLHDIVRRWIAPYDGDIAIEGPVTFEPTPDTRKPVPAYDGDGVRATIQRGADQLWTSPLVQPGETTTPANVSQVPVKGGDAVYFRLQSVDDGRRDQVRWDPVVRYLGGDTPRLDANGRDQLRYQASQDFTIAGRAGMFTIMPLDGRVRVQGVVHKTKPTTDDIRVVVEKNGAPVQPDPPLIPAGFVGDTPVSIEFDVLGPRSDSDLDKVALRLAVDSPIDVTALSWTDGKPVPHGPEMFYTEARAKDGTPAQTTLNGDHVLQMHPMYDIDLYSASNVVAPQDSTALFPDNGNGDHDETRMIGGIGATASLSAATPAKLFPARFVFTVKSRLGPACKQVVTLHTPLVIGSADCPDFEAREGEQYWFDFTVDDVNLVPWVGHLGVAGPGDLPHALHWPAVPPEGAPVGVFPESYRGWAFAGYNGDGARATLPIVEDDFTLKREDFAEQEPSGFKDPAFKDPIRGRAFPMIPFHLDLVDENSRVTGSTPVWRSFKDNLVGGAGFVRSSRTAADSPSPLPPSAIDSGGASARAVPRIGLTVPSFGVTAGLGPITATFNASPSMGLLDYLDMNGDSFPDIVAPGVIKYTGPRGGYVDSGGGPAFAGVDTTFAVGGGFAGSSGKIKANSKGDVGSSQDTKSTSNDGDSSEGSAKKGKTASAHEYGASIGAAADISLAFTNLTTSPEGADELQEGFSQLPVAPVDLEQELADVNGDGLPDHVKVRLDGVYVRLNTGYGFDEEIRWGSGGFEANNSFSGSVGAMLGFQINNMEFSGGLSYTEAIDFPTYSWVDVDGDGILDRLSKTLSDGVKVAFGTGAGLMPERSFGDFQDGEAGIVVPMGEQIAQNRTRGVGAGFDVTIGLGPFCPVILGCYIIINPGVHVSTSLSNTQVQVADINGDGYADSLKSDTDDSIEVALNRHGRSNLLRSVKNAIGGEIRLDYTRAGNTVDQPYSQWNLTMVEVDDGRPGDGADVRLTTFEYTGNRYSPLERRILGYSRIVERQRSFRSDGEPSDDPVLRSIERQYRNGTVFESGLMTSELLKGVDGRPLKETLVEWQFYDLDRRQFDDLRSDDAAGLRFLGMRVAPQRSKVEQRWYAGDGSLGQRTWQTFQYDDLGNVSRLLDVGEPELPADDVTAVTSYSGCPDSASAELQVAYPCPAPRPTGRVSPLWSELRCPTWTSIPATFQVLDWQGKVLRERNGAPALCDNSSVTHQVEHAGGGQFAVTDLSYDEWGSYNHIVYPANADGERVRIDYIYEETSHAKVGQTFRSLCVQQSPGDEDDPCARDWKEDITDEEKATFLSAQATFDGRTGRIASRTDANGQTTTYTYDAAGRIKTIKGPYEQGTPYDTVTFEYNHGNGSYAYAVARNFDAFRPDDPITTATFADGVGRQTQSKHDATVGSNDVMIVSGALQFDALGRTVKAWYPTTEGLGQAGRFSTARPGTDPTATTFDDLDRVTRVQHPNESITTTTHGFGGEADLGAMLFERVVVDPEGKPERTYTDVRNQLRALDDLTKSGGGRIRTRYGYDGLDQLVQVVDNGGNTTTHTYDLLGRRTSTNTPDGGLFEQRWDPASNLVAEIDPNTRAAGTQVTYRYDGEHLVAVDHPEGTPDVAYTWAGNDRKGDAAGNGAGRVVAVVDGARDQKLTYDKLGEIASEQSTMLVHNLNDAVGQRVTFRTAFTYDGFSRLRTVTYPDGELLTNQYDAGGLLRSVAGQKAGHAYGYVDRVEYDEFLDQRFQRTANGVDSVYTYDPDTRRLARQTTTTPTREIQDLAYGYDLAGNVKKADNQLPPPVSALMGGPSVQTYDYDGHHRLTEAKGEYAMAPDKVRRYTFKNGYDAHGNIVAKSQTDTINTKLIQKPTTYDRKITYRPDRPHQIAKTDGKSYSYDPNGNFTGWRDDRTGDRRTVTWDATDRVRSVADAGSVTRYAYDESGRLAIERGPQGETAFVNKWYTVRNGSVGWKHVWAGDDQVATKRQLDDGTYEHMRYFLHKDLQGSTNIVTDNGALLFQHLEYFPSGEQWVHEKSTAFRTPHLFTGAYFDEVRNLSNLGARWYEPREQFLYSPDPVLQDTPSQTVDDPALLPAYTYAEANPVRWVDLDGRSPSAALNHLKNAFRLADPKTAAPARQAMAMSVLRQMPWTQPLGARFFVRQRQLSDTGAPDVAAAGPSKADRAKGLAKAAFTEKALVTIKLTKTEKGWQLKNVKLTPSFSELGRMKVYRGAGSRQAARTQESKPPVRQNQQTTT